MVVRVLAGLGVVGGVIVRAAGGEDRHGREGQESQGGFHLLMVLG